MEIVFVHLGSHKADHLIQNIKHMRELFVDHEITLIYSNSDFMKKVKCEGIKFFKYSSNPSISELFNLHTLDNSFRDGFWRYSTERFFALEQWAVEENTKDFLHVESDNLILPSFPFAEFEKMDKLAWLRLNSSHDAAAIFYVPDITHLTWFCEKLANVILDNPSLNDMTALSIIANSNLDMVTILPTLPKSRPGDKTESFSGIFDAAAIGMWLLGQDPRNHYGIEKRFLKHVDSQVDPDIFTFEVSKNGDLLAKIGSTNYLVFNLHVHSKNLHVFRKNNMKILRKFSYDAKKKKNRNTVRFPILFSVVKEFLLKRGLLSRRHIPAFREFLNRINRK